MITAIRNKHFQPALACALLALATLAVYWPVRHHDFINFDDPIYVYGNPHVWQGLTPENIRWAFTDLDAGFWHPLTWLSIQFDCQLFGLNPGGHHFTNVLLHAANCLLLFLAFRRMTGAIWRSAFVAALFALHPLHVESVAWVAERKDVLSTFFGLLSLLAYVRWVEKSQVHSPMPKVKGRAATPHASRLYLLSLLLFAFSLMSKPLLVTLPFLLLLLDYWPLQRLALPSADARVQGSKLLRLLTEKLPFLAAALLCGLLTIHAQKGADTLGTTAQFPISDRICKAILSVERYLVQMVWPSGLAVYYPYPESFPLQAVLGAGLMLLAVSVFVLWAARRRPYLAFGWVWYLVTLLPVIGLIQVGRQAQADRWTYLPLIGISALLAWGADDLTRRWRHQTLCLSAVGAAVLVLCVGLTRQQIGYWKDSETLFRRALAVTTNNYVAHDNLGTALESQNRFDEALAEFESAFRIEAGLKLNPDLPTIRYDLGTALARKGRLEEAKRHLLRAVEVQPDRINAHRNLGSVLALQGNLDEAIAHYQEALRLKPDYDEARANLAAVLDRRQQWIDASSHYNSGAALLKQERTLEAIAEFNQALSLRPDWPEVANNLAWLLATHPKAEVRNGTQAVPLAERACQLTASTNLLMLSTLAAAYAEAGRFAEAVSTQQKLCDLAAAQARTAQSESFRQRLALYRAGQAYHRP